MWNPKLKSSSTTSTFLQTRKQRSPLRPWTPPTPDCSISSSFFCSSRSSASRNMLRHISSHKHKACRARTRPRFSSDSLHSAISLTRRVKLQSKLLSMPLSRFGKHTFTSSLSDKVFLVWLTGSVDVSVIFISVAKLKFPPAEVSVSSCWPAAPVVPPAKPTVTLPPQLKPSIPTRAPSQQSSPGPCHLIWMT